MPDGALKLVRIDWEDSAQPMSAWQYLDGIDLGGVVECSSVGWLVVDNDKMKALAPNIGCLSNLDELQASGFIRIPTRCVTKISILVETPNEQPRSLCAANGEAA